MKINRHICSWCRSYINYRYDNFKLKGYNSYSRTKYEYDFCSISCLSYFIDNNYYINEGILESI